MKINTREQQISRQGVQVAQNLKRESIMLDKFGNQIDPRTKQIIKKNNDKE